MSGSIKDQLKQLASSGKLVVAKAVKPTFRPKPITKDRPTQRSSTITDPKTVDRIRKVVARLPEPEVDENGEPIIPVVELSVKWVAKALEMIASVKQFGNRISVLSSVRDTKLTDSLNNIQAVVAKISGKIVVEQKRNRKRELTTARRACETLDNYINTVEEAADVNDIGVEHLKEVSFKIKGYLVEISKTLTAVQNSNKPVAKVDKNMQFLDESNVGRYRIFQRQLDSALADATANKKAVIVVDLPIIPIIEGGVFVQDLLSAGIAAEPIGGYSVLLKQRIIGISPKMLETGGYSKERYIKLVIDQLNARSKQEYALVMEQPFADKKTQMYYYWVMPTAQINVMLTAGGKQASINNWGFAF